MEQRGGEYPVAGGLYIVGTPIDTEPRCVNLNFFRCLARVPRSEVCTRTFPGQLAMWVGQQYTCHSFRNEARQSGVRKRIARIPSGVRIGQTVALLHANLNDLHRCPRCEGVPLARLLAGKHPPDRIAGVFDGFKITGFRCYLPATLITNAVRQQCARHEVTICEVEPEDPRCCTATFSPPQFLKPVLDYQI